MKMIGPQHIGNLLKYFDGIDHTIARTFLRPVPPDETALSSHFCALMDGETQQREKSLEFNLEMLNAALALNGDDLQFDFKIDTHQFTSKLEHLVSQSDLALVLEYQNYILPKHNKTWTYMLQAKRLHQSSKGIFDEHSTFKSFDHSQHQKLMALTKLFGDSSFKYFLYCPIAQNYDANTLTKIRAIHTYNNQKCNYDKRRWHGDLVATCLPPQSEFGHVNSGIWFSEIETAPYKLLSLHQHSFYKSWPFSFYILKFFEMYSYSDSMQLGYRSPKAFAFQKESYQNNHIVHGVATGQPEAIKIFCETIGEMDMPNFKILPANTITITATVGKSLPLETRRAFQAD